jgi:hypothetical protein
VTFSDITATGNPATIEMHGFDADHIVDGVSFDHVVVNGKPLRQDEVKENEFVKAVVVKP